MKLLNLIPLVCVLIAGCNSTKMTLKSLNQDIPTTLVDKYNSSTEDYVDEGESFFLPILLTSNEYVSKTADGFRGYFTANLGLILIDKTISSDFDTEGRIVESNANKTILTSLVYSESCHRVCGGDNPEHKHTARYLLNSFGVDSEKSGEKTLVLFWVPIRISEANKI